MVFDTAGGAVRTVSLLGCRDTVTAGEAGEAMDAMITSGAFTYEPSDKRGASLIERSVTELF
jgi:hypothetical protein